MEYHRKDVLVLGEDAGPDDVRRLREFVADRGGRLLDIPGGALPAGSLLRVSGVDAKVVSDLLWDTRGEHERPPLVGLKHQYAAGTHPLEDFLEPPTDREYGLHGDGVKAGHAFLTWVEELDTDLPDAPEWRRMPHGQRRPVVALVDTPVVEHHWLPKPGPDEDPFLLTPKVSWETTGSWWDDVKVTGHRGHGTFIAGLIRLAAQDAQILSVPVMRNDGLVDEDTAVTALNWLVDDYLAGGGTVDVVCLAFGRKIDPAHGDDGRAIDEPLRRLAAHGVRIVASAGNDGSDERVVPASLVPPLHGFSVGAGQSESRHAIFSNYGDWVNAWDVGENVLSIELVYAALADFELDYDGWARWSGTSFAAGSRAGKEAKAAQLG